MHDVRAVDYTTNESGKIEKRSEKANDFFILGLELFELNKVATGFSDNVKFVAGQSHLELERPEKVKAADRRRFIR